MSFEMIIAYFFLGLGMASFFFWFTRELIKTQRDIKKYSENISNDTNSKQGR